MTTDAQYVELAEERYGSDDVEIDHNPTVSRGEDAEGEAGAWVQAWVWIENPEREEEAA